MIPASRRFWRNCLPACFQWCGVWRGIAVKFGGIYLSVFKLNVECSLVVSVLRVLPWLCQGRHEGYHSRVEKLANHHSEWKEVWWQSLRYVGECLWVHYHLQKLHRPRVERCISLVKIWRKLLSWSSIADVWLLCHCNVRTSGSFPICPQMGWSLVQISLWWQGVSGRTSWSTCMNLYIPTTLAIVDTTMGS